MFLQKESSGPDRTHALENVCTKYMDAVAFEVRRQNHGKERRDTLRGIRVHRRYLEALKYAATSDPISAEHTVKPIVLITLGKKEKKVYFCGWRLISGEKSFWPRVHFYSYKA
jgi:hypothetical protein